MLSLGLVSRYDVSGAFQTLITNMNTNLLVGRLVIAVACGVAGGRRISTSRREEGGGAAGVPLGDCTSLFGLSATV